MVSTIEKMKVAAAYSIRFNGFQLA